MVRDIQPVTLDEFKIVPSFADGTLALQLSGMGDIVAVQSLDDCLRRVLEAVLAREIVSVEFDIRRVELLNSSCMKAFATFVIGLVTKKLHCPIRFIVNAKLPWQPRSLFALERLAQSLITIVPR